MMEIEKWKRLEQKPIKSEEESPEFQMQWAEIWS